VLLDRSTPRLVLDIILFHRGALRS
jgi:hypothetical protein